MTPPDHVGDDPVPHAGGGSQGLSTARLTGLLNATYAPIEANVADIIVWSDDGVTVQGAVLTKGLGTLATASSTDGGLVLQSAVNLLRNRGGGIGLKGTIPMATGVTLYPAISLFGQGLVAANPGVTNTCYLVPATAMSTPVITVAKDPLNANVQTFPWMSNFSISGPVNYGAGAPSTQDGVYFTSVNGGVLDCIMTGVGIFNVGGAAIHVNDSSMKLWVNQSYLENCALDGALIEAGFRAKFTDCYIFGNRRNGVNCQSNTIQYLAVTGCAIANNIKAGFDITRIFRSAIFAENHIYDNGDGGFNSRIQGHASGSAGRIKIANNSFRDSRGTPVTNHLRLNTSTTALLVDVTGNDFTDQSGDAIVRVNNNAGDAISTRANPGWNDTKGKITNPANLTNNTIGLAGTTNALTVSPTELTVQDASMYLLVTGGTGVSVLIKDPQGNSVESASNSYAKIVPVGFKVNVTFTTTPNIAAYVT